MRRAGCSGEVRSWRLVFRSIASLGNRCGVMTVLAYLILCLLPPRLCRHCFLPFSWRKDTEKGEGEGARRRRRRRDSNRISHRRRRSSLMVGDKRPRDKESSAEPHGSRRAHREFFQGRYLSALSSFFCLCILFYCVHDDTCAGVG